MDTVIGVETRARSNVRIALGKLSPRLVLGVVFATALLLRIGAVFYLRTYVDPEQWENGVIAYNIAHGHGFAFDYSEGEIANYYRTTREPVPTSYQAPFYPYLLAAFNLLGEHIGLPTAFLLLEVLQSLVGALTVLTVYAVAARASFPAKLIAGLTACYPPLVYVSAVTHQVVWVVWFTSLIVLGLMRLQEQPGIKRAVQVGAIAGPALLTEPVLALFVGSALVWLAATWRQRPRILGAVGLAGAVTVLMVAPWLLRCYKIHRHLVFIKSSGGFVLWVGNNPNATGVGFSGTPHVPFPISSQLRRRLNSIPNEVERDRLWLRQALSFIRANPARVVQLNLKKLWYFWSLSPHHPLSSQPAYWLPTVIVLAVSLPGLLLSLRGQRPTLIYILLAVYTAVYVVTYPGARFRMPLEPYLIMFGAHVLAMVWNQFLAAERTDGVVSRGG